MTKNWKETTLGQIAEITMGQSPPGISCNSNKAGAPLLNGPTEFGSSYPVPIQYTTDPRRFSEVGDILFCVRGSTTGRMNWSDQKYAIGRGLAAIRHKYGYEYQPFLKGMIDYYLPTLLSVATGSTFPNVSRNDIAGLKCLAPGLKEQKRIAEILGSLDDKIELNRKQNETLEAMARAVFQSWFVDFDPVIDNALAAGRPIPDELAERGARRKHHKTKHPLPQAIQSLFPDRFDPSPLGPIPKGWKVSTIGDEVCVVGGGTPSTKKAEYWDNGTNHFVTPKDLRDITSPVLLDTEREITDLGLGKVSSGLLAVGTVLLSSRAPIGYLAVAEIPVAINQGFIAMVCEKDLPNLYVLYWTMQNMEIIKGRANGTTFMEVSKKNFRPIEIVVPSKAVLDTFTQKVLPLYQDTVIRLKENKTLTHLRDSLLPKLLTGEIEV